MVQFPRHRTPPISEASGRLESAAKPLDQYLRIYFLETALQDSQNSQREMASQFAAKEAVFAVELEQKEQKIALLEGYYEAAQQLMREKRNG